MRKLLWFVVALTALYSGYWFVTAIGSERAIASWLDSRQSAGWQAEYDGVDTRGFPLRFDRVIRAPQLADPATGVAYNAPFVEISSTSYSPTALTATFAQNSTLSTPLQTIEVTQDTATADLFVEAGADLTLDRAAAQIDGLGMVSTLGWGLSLAHANVTMERQDTQDHLYAISAIISDLAPTDGLIAALERDGLLADRFERLEITGRATFDTAWDIHALEERRPQPTRIELDNLVAKWGNLDLQLAGAFDVDSRGEATGKIQLKARNWREMVALAVSSGLIPADLENLVMRAGQMLAGLKGDADTIDAELTLSKGTVSIGFIPIGPAPNFAIR